jgi:hypothetical protein
MYDKKPSALFVANVHVFGLHSNTRRRSDALVRHYCVLLRVDVLCMFVRVWCREL